MSEPTNPDPTVSDGARRGIRDRIVLVLVAVGIVAWAGLAFFADDVREGAALVAALDQAPTDSFSGDLRLTYDHHKEVVVTASIANHGWFPVTVTGAWMFPATPLDSNDLPYLLLKQRHVLVESNGTALPADRDLTEPIDLAVGSVTLYGGEELDISITAEFGDCDYYEPGTGNDFEVLGLGYRHLGIPQTVQIPVRHVAVEAPESCPAG